MRRGAAHPHRPDQEALNDTEPLSAGTLEVYVPLAWWPSGAMVADTLTEPSVRLRVSWLQLTVPVTGPPVRTVPVSWMEPLTELPATMMFAVAPPPTDG